MENTQKILKQVERFKELYIMTRHKWIQQNADGSYHHKDYGLHDDHIKKHLQKKITLGVFSGKTFTSWLCWDVDFEGDMPKAQQVTKSIIMALEEYGVGTDNILTSFSGSKGFHVTIFFDKVIEVEKAEKFNRHIVAEVGESKDKVEFRPNYGQGVKLPLSINKKTGKKQHFVDNMTLKKISDDALFQVKKLDTDRFLDNIADVIEVDKKKTVTLDKKKAEQLEEVMDKVKMDIPVDYRERCMKMLEENQLIYADSRHKSTYLLAMFLRELGYTQEQSVDFISKIIKNTFENRRHFIAETTTEEFALKEVARLTEYVFVNEKGIHEGSNQVIKLYENEILEVLKHKNKKLRLLAFIMLVHSKKYTKGDGEVFYMTHKQMAEMGADSNRTRNLMNLIELEEGTGFITVVERNRRQKNELQHLPNKYKVNVVQTTENFIELNTQEAKKTEMQDTLVDVVAQLIPKKVAQTLIEKSQFSREFAKTYKAKAV
jgi:hypothetical protein